MAEQIGEIKRVGGWRGSPNSLAALRTIPASQQRKCSKCRGVAMRGRDRCALHSGWRRAKPPGHGRAESAYLARLEKLGLLPLELLALPVWRDLMGLPTATRAPARVALVSAWDRRYSAPLLWATAQRAALVLGAAPGRRQNVAHWYENR